MSTKVCLIFNVNQPGCFNTSSILRRNSFDVTVLCLGYKSHKNVDILPNGEIVKAINWRGIYHSPFISFLNPLTRIKLTVTAIKENADIYWGRSYSSLATLMILKLFRKRVIYDVGDDDPSNIAYVIRSRYHLKIIASFIEKLLRTCENYYIKKMDYVITLTESLKKDRELYAKNIKSIYYCLEPSFNSSNSDESIRKKFDEYDVIVYSGTVSVQKAFIDILSAFDIVKSQNSKAFLLLVGGVLKSDEIIIRKLIKGREDIYSTGWLPYDEMFKYISVGKVGLALVKPANYSYKISLPFKVLEQMACGLPIIAPAGLPEVERIIAKAKCGLLVNVRNPQQVADCINYLLSNEKLLKVMGLRAKEYIKNYHSLEICEKEIMSVINCVLSR